MEKGVGAKDVNPNIIAASFDPGYSAGKNFKFCQQKGIRLFIIPKRNENFRQKEETWGEMGAEQGKLHLKGGRRCRDKQRKRSRAEGTAMQLKHLLRQGRFWLRKSKVKNPKHKTGPTPANGLPLPNPNDRERLNELPDALLAQVH